MSCEKVVELKCSKNHTQRQKCHQSRPWTCSVCEIDDKRQEKELEADLEIQNRRYRSQSQHTAEITHLDLQIRLAREKAADSRVSLERARALEQKKRDLDAAKLLAQAAQATGTSCFQDVSTSNGTAPVISAAPSISSISCLVRPQENASDADRKPEKDAKSPSEIEWERQKRVEGASNDAIDTLMGLTGLEDVKAKVLSIKTKIETAARQGSNIQERLGVVMLGNPGTGERCSV
jgi:hypothetical protein